MAKFRYYITDLFDGAIRGTNSEEDAKNFATSEDYFVLDSETSEWLTSADTREEVKEVGGTD